MLEVYTKVERVISEPKHLSPASAMVNILQSVFPTLPSFYFKAVHRYCITLPINTCLSLTDKKPWKYHIFTSNKMDKSSFLYYLLPSSFSDFPGCLNSILSRGWFKTFDWKWRLYFSCDKWCGGPLFPSCDAITQPSDITLSVRIELCGR